MVIEAKILNSCAGAVCIPIIVPLLRKETRRESRRPTPFNRRLNPEAAAHHFGPEMQGFSYVDCAAEVSIQNRQGSGFRNAAPVSHQKQPHQNATNVIEIEQKRSKINGADRYSAAHNGLVAGSSPARPTNKTGRFLHGWK